MCVIALTQPEGIGILGFFEGGCMSKSSRYEWRDQQAALHERMKGFLANPSNEQFEAVVAEMRAYADAAQSGSIEIPQRWTAYA